MKKVFKTWLPIFPGFYGTIFESDESEELDYIDETRKDNGIVGDITYDMVKWNYLGYMNDVARGCVGVIGCLLADAKLIQGMQFESVHSPREYNFTNDSINITVIMGDDTLDTLDLFILNRWDDFRVYLEDRYTSRSGFISAYPNDPEEWREQTDLFHDFSGDEHLLGAVLDFCARTLISEETDEAPEGWLRDSITDYPNVQALNYDELVDSHVLGDRLFKGEVKQALKLMSGGYEFKHGSTTCYALNRIQGEHRVTSFKGFWVKGDEVYGVMVSTPNLDVYGLKIV